MIVTRWENITTPVSFQKKDNQTLLQTAFSVVLWQKPKVAFVA